MVDVKSLSDEALAELEAKIQTERQIRIDTKKKEAWEAVRKSLQNYVETCGVIQCYDKYEVMNVGTISDIRTMIDEVGVLYLD